MIRWRVRHFLSHDAAVIRLKTLVNTRRNYGHFLLYGVAKNTPMTRKHKTAYVVLLHILVFTLPVK